MPRIAHDRADDSSLAVQLRSWTSANSIPLTG